MPRAYTKVEILSEEVFRRKAAGETNREIAESYGLTLKQIKKLITGQWPWHVIRESWPGRDASKGPFFQKQ